MDRFSAPTLATFTIFQKDQKTNSEWLHRKACQSIRTIDLLEAQLAEGIIIIIFFLSQKILFIVITRMFIKSFLYRSASKKTVADLTDSGVSVVSDVPPAINSRVQAWLMSGHNDVSVKQRSSSYRTSSATSPISNRHKKGNNVVFLLFSIIITKMCLYSVRIEIEFSRKKQCDRRYSTLCW